MRAGGGIRIGVAVVTAFFLGALACAKHEPPVTPPERPRRLVLIVVDQLREDYVDAVPLPNLQRLRDAGASFPGSYVGHLASKTIVSHPVITRGLFPRRIGWTDDLMRDAAGALGAPGGVWDTGDLTLEQMRTLLPREVPTLARAFPAHARTASIGQKRYSVESMVGHDADIVVTLSGALSKEEAGDALAGWMKPSGHRVPSYLAEPPGNRFWLDAKPTFGTDANPYRLGGTRMWRGDDPAHPGGDAWVIDAALAVMEREDWGALFLALGGVDRVGHMMGADKDLREPNSTPVRFRDALLEADRQVGRLLDALAAKKLDGETLVVLTADHGGMYVENLVGREKPGSSSIDWNWGELGNAKRLDPQPAVKAVIDGGGVAATSTDTAVRVWAIPGDPAAASLPERVAKMPGVISVWALRRDANGRWRYEETHRDFSSLPAAERAWQERHLAELVATSAAPASADVLALLDHRTGYAVRGDHGGSQRAVQSLPIFLRGPGVRPGRHDARARLVDIAPTVWALAGRPQEGLDGEVLCAAVRASPACR